MSSEDAALVTLCVADANILIDLENGGILRLLFELPYHFIIPDAILEELARPSPDVLRRLAFEVGSLGGESVQEVFALRPQHPQLSLNDLFALFLARDRGAMLLTGDHRLRLLAQEFVVPVHGTLWALESW